MDSFFSLFDPSDGQKPIKKQQHDDDNVKKKSDGPKGRRRGRKCVGKQEPLPEESSFLCEPQLSGEVLVHGGYIDSYIALPRGGCDKETKTDDNKPKRRISGRKNRRKKNKVSPIKDLQPNNSWKNENDNKQELDIQTQEFLNNKFKKTGNHNEAIGKNVNNLTDFKKNKRKVSLEDLRGSLEQLSIYNAVDAEALGLRHDGYLSDDDDRALYRDDSRSESDESDDSSDETYGSLPPEPRFGNVEYKLQLVAPGERRFQHLVTQLKWRLRSGGGSAVYVVGVRDCGALVGLSARALRASLRTLRTMAHALGATLAHCTARKLAPHRALAEVYIRKLADTQQSIELRVAVLGANEAGKSTLIGVLTQGELDNGRGSARLNMFRHVHEVRSGRTSSLSHEILGFDAQGNVVNYGCSELMTAERIGERSAKLVSFLDLAGHTKYQRTTLHGLSGYSPHYAMLVISATAGITSITEEHLALLLALDLPFFTVISKSELAPNSVPQLVAHLGEILQHHSKKPVLITDENAARSCVAPKKLIIDTIHGEQKSDDDDFETVPVFPVSSVRGFGINALHAYLLSVQPPAEQCAQECLQETCEFQIDEVFHVGDSGDPVVGGLVALGEIYEGDELIIGPLWSGTFVPVRVRSVYRNRAPSRRARAGQAASLCVSAAGAGGALRPRTGMVLLARGAGGGNRPVFGGCEMCSGQLPIPQKDEYPSRKNARRKNKNLLQDIAKAQNGLIKDENIDHTNIYTGESEKDNMNTNAIEQDDRMRNVFDNAEKDGGKRECTCEGKVFLEDPNDPRGCIYFQASIHVLRHPTAICPGFQCTVHVGNVRQTAIIEGIMSHNKELRAGESASVVFRFVRCPEYLVTGRRLLLTAGLGTRAIGRVTQVFPYIP